MADRQVLGTYRDWTAFVDSQGGQQICYIGSVPKQEAGDYTKRGNTYVLVTHRPADDAYGEVSVEAGYPYQRGSEVEIDVDGTNYRLFTRNRGDGDGNAWTYDESSDRKLVEDMKAGRSMKVKGTSTRGTLTTDTYSLLGFTAAYKAISERCQGGQASR